MTSTAWSSGPKVKRQRNLHQTNIDNDTRRTKQKRINLNYTKITGSIILSLVYISVGFWEDIGESACLASLSKEVFTNQRELSPGEER